MAEYPRITVDQARHDVEIAARVLQRARDCGADHAELDRLADRLDVAVRRREAVEAQHEHEQPFARGPVVEEWIR